MSNRQLIPNTCQVPNVILDEVMPKVSHAEFKIVMAIARKTYGWGKESDRISISQLMTMTGVSNRMVINAVRKLDWLITAHRNSNGTVQYGLNINAETGKLTKETCELSSQPYATIATDQPVKPVHRGCETSSQVSGKICETSSHTKPIMIKPTNKPKSKRSAVEPEIKRFTDQIYAIDPLRYKSLMAWVNEAKQNHFSVSLIASTLESFMPRASDPKIQSWWRYLITIIEDKEKKQNGMESLQEHEHIKQQERKTSRALFGGNGVWAKEP